MYIVNIGVQHRIANNVNIQTSHILYKYLRASDIGFMYNIHTVLQ